MSERLLDPEGLGDHLDRLYRVAWSLCGNRADAEDLVQETYARVLAKPRFLRNDDDVGYLLRVLRRTFIDQHRTAQRRPQTAVLAEGFEPEDVGRIAGPEAAFAAREVFAVIAALPEKLRDALVAVDVAGLSYAEAARLLKTKEATVTSRLFRAREQVAKRMESAAGGVRAGEGR